MSQVQVTNSESLFNRKDFLNKETEVTEKEFPLCAESFRHPEHKPFDLDRGYLCLLLLNSGLHRFAPGGRGKRQEF
ncbi:hypothetical protein SBV1_2710009 [Verrucomicrobia bacterium]|nr:hypothetical protein SBV1_2710009 [Verrucomicrobiota bacterium]